MTNEEEKSFQPKALWAALAAAQQEFPVIGKDKENSHFKSRYADLATVIGATRAVLYKHGLFVNHRIEIGGETSTVTVVAQLVHFPSGQCEECPAAVPVSKADAQGYKSAVTYAKRITYETILGLAPDDDDDGEAAVGRPASKKQQSADTPSPRPPSPPPPPADKPTTVGEISAEIAEAVSAISFKRIMKRIEGASARGEITAGQVSALVSALADREEEVKGMAT